MKKEQLQEAATQAALSSYNQESSQCGVMFLVFSDIFCRILMPVNFLTISL